MANNEKETKHLEHLFKNTHDTCVFSCLQQLMGDVYYREDEESAVCVLGSYAYLGGEPDESLLLHVAKTYRGHMRYLIPMTGTWNALIKQLYQGRVVAQTRYALSQEGTTFDMDKLALWVGELPDDYCIERIDAVLYEKCHKEEWSRDFVCNYGSYVLFEKCGLGYVILKGDEPVAGASSYSSYRDGIEVSIATKEPFRRQGLARICAAKLILDCLDRGWYPNWDAANKKSLGLAKQLGYHYAGEYCCFKII